MSSKTKATATMQESGVEVALSNGDRFSILLRDLVDIDGTGDYSPEERQRALIVLKAAFEGLIAGGYYEEYRPTQADIEGLLAEFKISRPIRIRYPEAEGAFRTVLLVFHDSKVVAAGSFRDDERGVALVEVLQLKDLSYARPLEEMAPAFTPDAARQAASELIPGYKAQSLADQAMERIAVRTNPSNSWPMSFYWSRKGQPDRYLLRADGVLFEAERGVQDLAGSQDTIPVREIGRYQPRKESDR